MAQKYFLEYNDVENIVHRLEISSDDYIGSTTEINGSVFMTYATTTGAIEAIRGKGLKVSLEASNSLTFSDLYSEVDRTWSVVYKRDNVILFNGWLDSDGLFEDFISDHWIISLDCVDGFGYLKDLSYVDSSGVTFSGKQKLLDIIVNCLARTGIEQNINTNIDIYYEGLSTSLDMLDNVYFNANRFVKDDNETIMSCEEVLKGVLEPFAACITTFEGEWYIYKPNQIFLDSTPTFFRYDNDGVALSPTTKVLDVSYSLGSQSDSFFPHHCNANQRIENNKSIGAYRVNYKYGLVKSLIDNVLLTNVLGTIADWTINSGTYLTFPTSNNGVIIEKNTPVSLVMTSDVISLGSSESFNFTSRFKTTGESAFCIFKVILTGASTYYMDINGEWSLSSGFIKIENSQKRHGAPPPGSSQGWIGTDTFLTSTIKSLVTPLSGNLTIEIYTSEPFDVGGNSLAGTVEITEISLAPTVENTAIKGEFHTFQRNINPSAKIKDTIEVFNGDNPSDIYIGTVYQSDSTTPTELWFRKGITEEKRLLEIMGEETLRLNANPMTVFTGSVFGYIPYLSRVDINNVTGKFIPIAYNYNTKANVTDITFVQIFGDELADISYELTFDYGNTVKPTIKG